MKKNKFERCLPHPPEREWQGRTWLSITGYSFCSSLLLILNKRVLLVLGAPATLSLCQSTFSVGFLALAHVTGKVKLLEPMSRTETSRFILVVGLFVLTLFASMKSLQFSNVDTVVCLRMTAPVLISFLEYFTLGRELPSTQSMLSMVGVALCFSLHLFSGFRYEASATTWLSVWYFGLLFEALYVKHAVSVSKLSTLGQSFYQNLLSIPLFAFVALYTEQSSILLLDIWSLVDMFFLLLSCALGLGMSYLSFLLRSQISATSFHIVGNSCMLITILINLAVWEKHASNIGTVSVIIGVLFSVFYKQAPMRKTSVVLIHSPALVKKESPANHYMSSSTILVSAVIIGTVGLLSSVNVFTRPALEDGHVPVASRSISGVSGKTFLGEQVRKYSGPSLNLPSFQNSTSAFLDDAGLQCEHWAVCTTIFEPSEAVKDVCTRLPGYCLVIVSDRKGQDKYHVDGKCTFIQLSVARQEELASASHFASNVPWNHFGRKNLGYLFAIANGAKKVWDFDDDNILISSLYLQESTPGTQDMLTINTNSVAINPYPLFGAAEFSWPRGFPLEQIKNISLQPDETQLIETDITYDRVGVVQMLANNDPDVDAIYRLQRPIPFNFNGWGKSQKTFLVPQTTFIPWNAQATFFTSEESLWATYLPMSVHGRVSDIWRSFVAQRLFREVCIFVSFSANPQVIQIRNPHSFLADFDAEQDLFYKSGQFLEWLDTWSPITTDLQNKLFELYVDMYERGYIEIGDVEVMRYWILELKQLGYVFPTSCL